MARRGRPRRKPEHSLPDLLAELVARCQPESVWRWEFDTNEPTYQRRLVAELAYYLEQQPEEVRRLLELPADYDRGHSAASLVSQDGPDATAPDSAAPIPEPGGVPEPDPGPPPGDSRVLGVGAPSAAGDGAEVPPGRFSWPARPSYRFLPEEVIVHLVKKLPQGRQEPLVQYHIEKWQQVLLAQRGNAEGAKLRRLLKRIDPALVPAEATGAGQFGNDQDLLELYESTHEFLRPLYTAYGASAGSIYGDAETHRFKRLQQTFDTVVFEATNQWYYHLCMALGLEEVPSRADLRAREDEVVKVLGEWIPGTEPGTPEDRAYEVLAAESGLTAQSVRNAVKRARRAARENGHPLQEGNSSGT